jgi:hypothetical protein
LGATRMAVAGMILRESAILVFSGTAAGIVRRGGATCNPNGAVIIAQHAAKPSVRNILRSCQVDTSRA